jgi:pilus assembly protein CpaE
MRTLIVGRAPHDPAIDKLKDILSSLGSVPDPQFSPFEGAEHRCAPGRTELVIVHLADAGERGPEVIGRLREAFEGHLLAIGQIVDPKVIMRSLQAGADLFVDEAEVDTELEAALCRLTAKHRGSAIQGRLIGVLSAGGGAGASTVAVNLAAALARANEKCAVFDLNPGRGDLAALLDLKPAFTLADLCLNQARHDRAMLDKMLVRHPRGIYLLGAPTEFSDARAITATGVKQALSLARKQFPDTVVDLEDCFHGEQVEAIQLATSILLICRLDFTSLRHARRMLDQLSRLGISRGKIKVVVNQHGQPNELPVEEAAEALGTAITAFIPHDPKTINAANNIGLPAVLKDPDAKVSQALTHLATNEVPRPASGSGLVPRLKSLLSRVFPGDERPGVETC